MQYGLNTTIPADTPTPFSWNGRSGELAVETSGTVKIQRKVRTKFVDIPDLEVTGDALLIFQTTGTELQVISTGAPAEVVITPFYRG